MWDKRKEIHRLTARIWLRLAPFLRKPSPILRGCPLRDSIHPRNIRYAQTLDENYFGLLHCMKFELEDYHRGITDEELITELRRVSSVLKKNSVSRFENDQNGKYGTTTYIRRFGSWFNSLEKAGLQKTRTPMNLPEEELFKNLEEVWIKLGRQPRYSEVQKPLSRYHVGTYENRYGTWRNALGRFVSFINNEAKDSTEKSLEKIAVEPATKHKTKRNINWRLRFIVMRQNHFKCSSCGRSPATDPKIILHVDHIKAWANGGETVLENLQTLCSICNIGKSDIQ